MKSNGNKTHMKLLKYIRNRLKIHCNQILLTYNYCVVFIIQRLLKKT